MLEIKNLKVKIVGASQADSPGGASRTSNNISQNILAGIDLSLPPGETHVIMGPNGSGKSTLAGVLAGQSGYHITAGQIMYNGQDLTSLTPEQRAAAGIFLGFQQPLEINGVNNGYFLKTIVNAKRRAAGQPVLDAVDFLEKAKKVLHELGLPEEFLERDLNAGFSGGQKKSNEILQMVLLEPRLVILDEIDSGLDVDALQHVARGIKSLQDRRRSFLIITHYPRLIKMLRVDRVHVLRAGQIVRSGPASLAAQIERRGYEQEDKNVD